MPRTAMTSRRRLLLVCLVAGLVAFGVGVWLLVPRSAINHANAAKVQKGMTLAEVEAILGGRARNESSGRLLWSGPNWRLDAGDFLDLHSALERLWRERHRDNLQILEWRSDVGFICLAMHPDGRVVETYWMPLSRTDGDWLYTLRHWLRP